MLGVCWYPEQWPRAMWQGDARRMKALGLTYVRVGEFGWSRFEPDPGRYDWTWFDEVLDILHGEGLRVVACTPTATPPKWLVDAHPDILPVHPGTGRVRGFGSRRHYDFSSRTYLAESNRITQALAERYGQHPAVAGWQTDNELCCHDTALSASSAARDAFRRWCADRYGDVATLNAAWGNAFWSMEYRSFDEIELPVGAVTECNPSHRMAWRRFSSDQVVRFHRAQIEILRAHSPGRFVTHNFIPMDETGVDNHSLAQGLDFASYDNYPLGRTDILMRKEPPEMFQPFMRTGHPDYGACFFDQTRGLAPHSSSFGPFWIMEQQPGPVNWAGHNPRPAPGMVRLWTLEAFAHGAGVVSYFRWRQAPFAQEQMHAGLNRPDDTPAEAWAEVEAVVRDLATLDLASHPTTRAPAAMLVDCEAQWLAEIERHGDSFHQPSVLMAHYQALRSLGVDVDVIGPDGDPSSYALVVVPGLATARPATVAALKAAPGLVLFAPRCGAKTVDLSQPQGLAPGLLRDLVPMRVLTVETTRPDSADRIVWGNREGRAEHWRETVEAGEGTQVVARYDDGQPAALRHGRAIYMASLTDRAFLTDVIEGLCEEAGIATVRLPETLRVRRRGDLVFAFNYAEASVAAPAPKDAAFVLGGAQIGPRDVAVWRDGA